MSLYLFQILNGVGLGLIYFLMAVGLSIIFGMMNFVNFAHGLFYVAGAFLCFQFIAWSDNFWLGLTLAPLVTGLLALVIERIFIRRLYHLDHSVQILVTIGLMLVLRESALVIWGTVPKSVTTPELLSGVWFFGDFAYPKYRFFLIGFSIVIGAALWLLLERTRFGMTVRAGSENPKMLSLLGINTNALFARTFVLGVVLAGMAGALMTPIRGADAFMGGEALGIAFVVVVIGGMGSFFGALLGGLVVGLVQSFTSGFWPEGTNVMIFAVMALIILMRPNGILGRA